ncbi:N-acetylmuramoyl-L-alanine amidase family protein [Clostridium saccharoperbutylacetonicum]|uniref:N-acetylmuramoyl-L-alanine amidase family protein n=1 Tax=Clostridium saccharoperbutylacetonicum TaxID=36745 RepID=UPI000983FFE7|nr:N-acetylmuramoyl-L-alanine amidase family protein [Clostridium saccharoperbutylacetonicum]AQR93120.1 toxin A [Clostridium saccharoperbutylacetonicum]NSB34530.1 glucan-binding YG repeat protein [Clostridium saccharoperbutylacetonicum]
MDDNGGEWVQETVNGNSFWYYYDSNGDMVTGWIKSNGDWYYCYDGGAMARDTMVHGYYVNDDGQWTKDERSREIIDGKGNHFYYYIGPSGKAVTGWNKIGENFHYYNSPDGSMTRNNTIDGFDIDDYGNIDGGTGWLRDEYSGKWYYYLKGSMQTGWVQGNYGTWYFLKSDGSMATGWQCVKGFWYYLQSDGSMASKKWVNDGTGWYYLYEDGSMARGTTANGYYVDQENGKMVTGAGWQNKDNKYFYLNSDDSVVTGWLKDKNNWYYFYPENSDSHYQGEMAEDTIINGWKVDSSGKWITDTNKYSDDVIIPEKINDNTNVYSRDDADKYINTSISVFGRGISVGRKTYFANEISDLPKEIRYESGGYTYIYTLQEIPIFDGVFGSEPIYGMIITTKDDKVFNNKKYAYVLSYTDEPQMSIGVISVLPPEMPAEGIGGEIAANEAAEWVSNPLSNDVVKQLENAPIETKLNKVTEQMEPYMKQVLGDDYTLILRRDVGKGFSHGDLDHWNIEVQTSQGKMKFDRHLYVDAEGNIQKIVDYIPQRRGKPIVNVIFDNTNK